jgi:hypothetical protein
VIRGREHERPGLEHLVGRLGCPLGDLLLEFLPVDGALGDGDILRRLDERAELRVGDGGLVHPEAVDPHAMRGPLVGKRPRVVGAHRELAAGDPGHARGPCGD